MNPNILIVAEHDGRTLSVATAKCVACATTVTDAAVTVVICAADATDLAQQAATLAGVGTVLTVEHPVHAHPLAAAIAAQIAALAAPYTHVFGPEEAARHPHAGVPRHHAARAAEDAAL